MLVVEGLDVEGGREGNEGEEELEELEELEEDVHPLNKRAKPAITNPATTIAPKRFPLGSILIIGLLPQ